MSARWLVGLRCNGCGDLFGAEEYEDRNRYVATLARVRALATRAGWTHHQGGPHNRHRDYCLACSRERQ